MPHATLKLIPGVDQNRTETLNEAAIYDCNLIRFMPDRQGQGLPQKLGGWTQFLPDTSWNSPVRALHSWADTNSNDFLAVGSDINLWASKKSPISISPDPSKQLSPQYYTANITPSITTTAGSAKVIVNDTGSNVTSYGSIFIETPISVDGIVLFGFYSCSAINANSYNVYARNIIGQLTPAISGLTGGAVPTFTSTSSSQTITVTLANHGYTVGSTFPVLVKTTIGGVDLYGNYIVTSVLSATQFNIAASNIPSSVTTVSMNGGKARVIYFVGQAGAYAPTGYGADTYGSGGYGLGVTSSGAGRQYTGTTVSTVGTVTTVTIPSTIVSIPPGTVVQDTATPTPKSFTVTSSSVGAVNSTFTFTGIPTGTTFTMISWGFVMPDPVLPDWSLDNWGEYLIASPHNGEIFYWNPSDANGSAVVVPNAPLVNEGCFVAMPERQIVAYGSTLTGIQDPMLVRWCDVGDFTDWVGTVTNQAGSFRIPKGAKIVGGMQGPQQGLIWTDIGLWAMQYINLPLVYSFNEIASGCGLVGRKAMGTLAGVTYWMSQSQFFSLSGSGVQPVPCPVWDVVFQQVDKNYWENVRCAVNSRFGEVAWYYPVSGSNGVPTHYVKYNALLGQWDFGELTRTAWIDQGVFGPPIGAGGDLVVYQHETSNDANLDSIDAWFQTGYFAIQDGDLQSFVDQIWPDMKWEQLGSNQSASVKITLLVADYPGDTPRVQTFTVNKATKYITPRVRGRLVSIKVESSDFGSFWRLGGIRYRFQQDGKF